MPVEMANSSRQYLRWASCCRRAPRVLWPWQIYKLSVGPVEPHRWKIDRFLTMSTMTIHRVSSSMLPSEEEVVGPFSGNVVRAATRALRRRAGVRPSEAGGGGAGGGREEGGGGGGSAAYCAMVGGGAAARRPGGAGVRRRPRELALRRQSASREASASSDHRSPSTLCGLRRPYSRP